MKSIHAIFGRFQNLNLAFLIEDLRRGLTTAGDWESEDKLCPVAHGMPNGQVVRELKCLSQAVNLETACDYAGKVLGATRREIEVFVDRWDSTPYTYCLLQQLEGIWAERLEDAEFMQRFLDQIPVGFRFSQGVTGADPYRGEGIHRGCQFRADPRFLQQ